jgi:membrane protein
VGALGASLIFGLYLNLAPELGATFGVLGAVALALVWLYLGAFAILLGGVVVAYTLRWHSSRNGSPE